MKTIFITLVLFSKVFNFELAVTEPQKMKGLMWRHNWGNTDGMLFINKTPRQVTFWMKNTYLKLSILYMDSNFNILETHLARPLSTALIPSRSSNIKYILEVSPTNASFILKHHQEFKTKLTYDFNQTNYGCIVKRSEQ